MVWCGVPGIPGALFYTWNSSGGPGINNPARPEMKPDPFSSCTFDFCKYMEKAKPLEAFYRELSLLVPQDISRELGHFNVFNIADLMNARPEKQGMPYNRRAYYKISFIRGRNRAEYADKVIEIGKEVLLFATPKVPYNWIPYDEDQSGDFCIFTDAFMVHSKTGVVLDDLPLFRSGGYPVFLLSEEDAREAGELFRKMHRELASDYIYKYDLLRNYVLELIHLGQKLQPVTASYPVYAASARISSLFVELLERQFPIESAQQTLTLRTPKDYAGRLAVHVNHLNKVLKENTGKTTTAIIASRLVQEAKILLKQTDWSVSEIAHCLGFDELAHFSNFFRRQTSISPQRFRS